MGKETAEQKLLKLIETTDSQDGGAAEAQTAPSAEAQKMLDSVRGVGPTSIAIPSFLGNFMLLAKDPVLFFKSVGLKELNRVMGILIIVVFVYFGLDFSRGMKLSETEVRFPIQESIEAIAEGLLPTVKELAGYIEVVKHRSIFHPYVHKVVMEEAEIPEELKGIQKIRNKTKSMKLVGISWLDTPESASAMIEDTGSGVTHFLRAGERIQGVIVQAIYTDSIVVVYDGEELEMNL